MGRVRFVVAVLVGLCLALPPIAHEAQAADTTVDCGFQADVKTEGLDANRVVAAYTLHATWCIETTYETRTITEESSGTDAVSGSSDEAKVEKQSKAKKGKKGRKGKKARRRAKRRSGGGGGSSGPRTRTERRAVSECITDFKIEAKPDTTFVDGVDLLGVTTTEVPGDSCSSRSVRVVGRFGRDYIPDVPPGSRSVISETIAGVTLEHYPLGNFGHFDVVAHFARDGGATCDRCLPSFSFCDVRIVSDDDASCLNL